MICVDSVWTWLKSVHGQRVDMNFLRKIFRMSKVTRKEKDDANVNDKHFWIDDSAVEVEANNPDLYHVNWATVSGGKRTNKRWKVCLGVLKCKIYSMSTQIFFWVRLGYGCVDMSTQTKNRSTQIGNLT